jgi:antitoxin HigA-1
MTKNGMRPVPPGEILREEFLAPAGLTANALAKAIGVPANRITAILNGQRGITGDTALRLAAFFGTTPDLWLNLQKAYELRLAEKVLPQRELKRIERRRAEMAET